MFSQEQQDKVRTSAPSLWSAIWPFVGGVLMLATLPVASGGLTYVILFGGVSGLWWLAYRSYRRRQIYGTSYLRLETAPVPLGKSLRARLQVPVPPGDQPSNGFQVRVAATQESGDDEGVVWEDWTSVPGQPGAAETEVPLSLDLPAQPLPDHRRRMAEDKPWGSVQDTLEKLDWTLEVTASFDEKPEYEASFDIPVSVPDDLDERAAEASANGAISSPASGEPEAETAPVDATDEDEVYWGVDGDGEEADLRRADSDADASDDAEEGFTKPVSEGIRMDGRPGEGLTFSFEHARPSIRSFGYKVAVPGTLFTGTGVSLLLMALSNGKLGSVLVGVLFGSLALLLGGLALWAAWKILTHASSIRVAKGQVEVQKGPFFLDSSPTRMSCEEVEDTTIKATGSFNNRSLYRLSLVKQGAGTLIPVAEGLTDKDEAEWIAGQIRQAAEQHATPA